MGEGPRLRHALKRMSRGAERRRASAGRSGEQVVVWSPSRRKPGSRGHALDAFAVGESLFFASAQRKVTAPDATGLRLIPSRRRALGQALAALLNASAFGGSLFFDSAQRKVTAPDATGLRLIPSRRRALGQALAALLNASAFGGSLFFDSAQRKVTKRKGASPKQLTRVVGLQGIFRLAIHGSIGKRRASCAPPSGSGWIRTARVF